MTDTRFHSLFDGCLDIDLSLPAADLLKALPSGRGLLLFCDLSDRPIQLLASASMRAAATARLAPQAKPVPTKRPDLSSVIARIYHLSTYCDFRSTLRYRQIAMELHPGEYRKMMNLGRLSLVKIDIAAPWPYFSVVQRPMPSQDCRLFGPFPSHRSATAFAQALNHAFLLCSEPALAVDQAKARSCPYLQMSTCPAPCVGRSKRDDYLQRVESALCAAQGQRQAAIELFAQQMQTLASDRKFEEANQVKLSLQSLRVLVESSYAWTTDLANLAVLHIDRSRKVKTPEDKKLVQSFAAFLVRPGRLDELADFVPAGLAATLADASQRLLEPIVPAEPLITDSLCLLEIVLYRSNPPGVVLDMRGSPTADEVATLLAARFARPDAPSSTSTAQ